jgi:hypothetical protein
VANIWPKIGVKLWAKQTTDAWVAKLRGMEPQKIIVHVSHPRTKSLAGYFNAIHFDPTTGTGMAGLDSFDAVEVNGDIGTPDQFLATADASIHMNAMMGHPDSIPTMRDWFAMLNQGKTTCALGNSDTHFRNGGTGYPRNYLKLGFDDPRMATGAALVDAIARQQVVVSNGPFVTLNAMGLGEVQTSTDIHVKVQAPSWIDTATIEVYGNGRPVPLLKNGSSYVEDASGMLQAPIDVTQNVTRLDGTITVKPARDTWYVVVVRGGGNLAPVDGAQPYAYTNPIYIDTGGDGWSAPGL